MAQQLKLYYLLQDSKGLQNTLAAAQSHLKEFESTWQRATAAATEDRQRQGLDSTYRRYLGNGTHNLACLCSEAKRFADAIPLFEKSLQFRQVGPGYMFLAAAHMANDDQAGALAALQRMHQSPLQAVQKWLFLGEAKKWFERETSFEPVQKNEAFTAQLQAKAFGRV